MVDFQSRETRRDDDEEEAPDDGSNEPDDDPLTEESEHHEHDEDEEEHDHHHHDVERVGVAILTVSSSRSLDDDPAGDAIAAAFEADGHEVVTRELVRDSYDRVQGGIDNLADRGDVDVVVTTGGTGVTPDDITVEAAEPLFEKELPGFGELFRRLSYEEIGEKVVATRATAGVADGVPVFCLPGSENAAKLGSEEVVVPEIGHLVGLASREDT
ncbi:MULTISPECIES: molybdenum cofactor biosynthesis protein B [Halobacterium]|uniref:MogA/MoaB family molybdenum cofactor biosynthesis protein n=1 Tax=Halobacterium TaxID=2239 RepID=UPI00073E509E|nr:MULTISPECIES: molybdenum cofactor synthesis domain-containing protein [Halobacterium]MCG1003828.1 molybdenum cofactor biosynthesis protein [Halobacterium noricense]